MFSSTPTCSYKAPNMAGNHMDNYSLPKMYNVYHIFLFRIPLPASLFRNQALKFVRQNFMQSFVTQPFLVQNALL